MMSTLRGASLQGDGMLLGGPSVIGLVEPGCATTAFLGLIATTLLTTQTSVDSVVVSQMLLRLKEEVIQAFRAAAEALMSHTPERERRSVATAHSVAARSHCP